MTSHVEQVRDEIHVHRATGSALNRLSKFYGFDRPLFIKDQYWREALRNAVYSAKGTRGVLNAFLEALFGEYTAFASYTFEVINANTLRWTGSNLNLCNLDNRYVNINNKRYFITHHSNNIVYLASTSTTDWRAGDLSGDEVTLQVLPYLIEEHSGEVKLIIDNGLFIVPPTYLREDAEARTTDPFGGHIMDFFSDDVSERFNSPLAGEYPAYPAYLLLDIFFERFFEVINQVLSASIKLTVVSKQWCENAPSLYASFTHLFKYGSVDPQAGAVQPLRTQV